MRIFSKITVVSWSENSIIAQNIEDLNTQLALIATDVFFFFSSRIVWYGAGMSQVFDMVARGENFWCPFFNQKPTPFFLKHDNGQTIIRETKNIPRKVVVLKITYNVTRKPLL